MRNSRISGTRKSGRSLTSKLPRQAKQDRYNSNPGWHKFFAIPGFASQADRCLSGFHHATQDKPIGQKKNYSHQGKSSRINRRQWKAAQHDIMHNIDTVSCGQEIREAFIGSHIRRRSRKNPLKKMLAKSKSIENWTACVSFSETREIKKPTASEVNSKRMTAIA